MTNHSPPLIHPSNHARVSPNKVAYHIAGTSHSVSYEALDKRSNQIARVFRNLGLCGGDGIALLLTNEPEFFEICWAAQRSGLYYTPISTHLKAEEIRYILTDCDAGVFVASAKYEAEASVLRDMAPTGANLLCVGGDIEGYTPLSRLADAEDTRPLADETSGSSLLYSSGTTGYPKGIRRPLTGEAIDVYPARYHSFRDRYDFSTDTVYLSPAPLYHAAPLGFTMATMAFGGTVIVMERFDALKALENIERYTVTHSQWVPTMFIRMLRLELSDREKFDLSSHRVAIHAAAPCPVATKHEMIDWWGPIVHEYYAGSEGVGSTHITAEEWLRKPGSVGKSAGPPLHILDEGGEELASGGIGTIYFEDAPRFHYHNSPEKTDAAFSPEGWGTLGDVGYLDDEGYLFLTDRKANMIISGGVNIYPQEAENTLLNHPAVLDAAVFGVPNEDFGEEVKAVVQPIPGLESGPALETELIEYCRSRIATIKCPRSIDFQNELPRLPNGKLYKRDLKARYWPSPI